jgi:hypothetical protein
LKIVLVVKAVRAAGHQFQVLDAVIELVAVFVVDDVPLRDGAVRRDPGSLMV